jgi:hypothetical protein
MRQWLKRRGQTVTLRTYLPVVHEIQGSRIKSLRGVARTLAARGVPTARGGAWTPVQVSAILRRTVAGDIFSTAREVFAAGIRGREIKLT